MIKYYDKHGVEIKKGMKLKHDDGDVEEVFSNADEDDLGFNASNKEFFKLHPDADIPLQIYPLYQFNLKEWEIVPRIVLGTAGKGRGYYV